MADERRQEKVNQLIRDELARIIEAEIQPPQGVIITVTRFVSSSDLYYGDAYISVFPKKEQEMLSLLNKKVSHIQQLLNKQLRMRPIPRIIFKLDEEEKSRERLEKLLSEIEKEGKK